MYDGYTPIFHSPVAPYSTSWAFKIPVTTHSAIDYRHETKYVVCLCEYVKCRYAIFGKVSMKNIYARLYTQSI